MRFVETLTDSVEDRLTANRKDELHRKVANSEKSEHKGYPNKKTGFFPYLVVDPEHHTKVGVQSNICYDDSSDKATVFTACLGFPHLDIEKHSRSGFNIRKLTSYTSVNSHEVIDEMSEDTKRVLHERERLRMKAVKSGHEYNISDDKTLTANKNEKIIINAYRVAQKRTDEPTAEDVKDVITFKRNRYQRFMSVSLDELTDEYVENVVSNNTCSPIIPSNENQKKVLLYWIDNPDAGLTEVIKETGISRGKFETFRLNLPDVSCYNRDYIASLSFDENLIVTKLKRYMKASPHSVYPCSMCNSWSYSKSALAAHKTHSKSHEVNHVTEEECPEKPTDNNKITVKWENTSVDDMLEVFESKKLRIQSD